MDLSFLPDQPKKKKEQIDLSFLPDQPEERGFVSEMVSNIPESGYEFGKSLATAVIHPVETAKSLGKMALGTIQLLAPGEQGYEQYAEAMGEYFKDRYGGLENIKKTVKKDPVGFLADASTFLMGSGAALKVGGIAKTGKMVSELGKLIEPTTAVIKTAGMAISKTKPVIKGALGFTTRMGPESVGRAMKGTKEFKGAALGKIPEETIVGEARSGLQAIKDHRAAEYADKLSQLEKVPRSLDISSLHKHLDDLLDRYRVKIDPDGNLDFSRSVFDRNARGDVEKIVETIRSWGSQKGDRTVIGLDTLKRQLDDFYSPSKNSEAFVVSLRNKTKDIIVKQVPEYGEMTKQYAELSDTINAIEKGLSLGNKTSIETAMKKLTSKMRSDSKFSQSLVEIIEERSGKPIGDLVAGYQAREWYPRTLPGAVMLGGAGLMAYLLKPELFVIASTTSPKLVGMTLNLLGETAHKMGKIPKSQISAFGFQAGRIKQKVSPPESRQSEQEQ